MHIQLPYSNAKLHTHLGKRGTGMGAVLLSKGGTGGASSYPSVEDYMKITGRKVKPEPITGEGFIHPKSIKLDKLGEKLSNLSVQTGIKPRIKNITMSI